MGAAPAPLLPMETENQLSLTRNAFKRRSFLLGNKRALALTLPVAAGPSGVYAHAHKWFGAYLYGHKFLEGQVVRADVEGSHLLNSTTQVGFTMGLTTATRHHRLGEVECAEEYFVPDGIPGLACTLSGDLPFVVEPELDIRTVHALERSVSGYGLEERGDTLLLWNEIPNGEYDDRTESFAPSHGEGRRMYAAVRVIGPEASMELLPPSRRSRSKVYRRDQHRRSFVRGSAPPHAGHDHAPLWAYASARVYAPARIHIFGHGSVVYGFGSDPEEAIAAVETLAENLIQYRAQKRVAALEILDHAHFRTGRSDVDLAHAQTLTRLMDALVARHVVPTHTAIDRPTSMILAGNQYFFDSWKRDENIALGFVLALGFYDLARDIIRDTWQFQDLRTGRLPQRIRLGEAPAYHSSDGTLWALHRLHQYWRSTGDDALLHEKLPLVETFFRRGLERTVHGLLPSGRTESPDYLWETWMDTEHTPRHGFPVEIQMLWIAALRAFRPLLSSRDPSLAQDMALAEATAWVRLQSFNVRGLPADSADEEGVVRDLITPNPFFCFGVGLDLGPEVETVMRHVGRSQLAGRQGILTLSPEDWPRVFPPEFLADRRAVRGRSMRSVGKYNYHRGVEWNWLTSFFVQGELKYGNASSAYRTYLRKLVTAVLERGGVGGISELFDLSGTRGPDFQAWSMSSFLEALHAFAGIGINVPEHTVTLAPQLPPDWPEVTARGWYGAIPFDLTLTRRARGQHLSLSFPWGQVPDATFDVSLLLPAHLEVAGLSTSQPDALHGDLTVEPLPGTELVRVRFSLRPGSDLDLDLSTRRRLQHRLRPA